MHGLINRSIQRFVVDEYGQDIWQRVVRQADLGFANFEAMWLYEDALTGKTLRACAAVLGRPQCELMEDIGTYLVAHPNNQVLRRLLRFGGQSFADFLLSLDELPQRARMAIAQLDIPPVDLQELTPLRYRLCCGVGIDGYAPFVAGVLRAMADDYGALVLIEQGHGAWLDITLLEARFHTPRAFVLGAKTG